jgi:hypothetical protein
MSDPNHIEPVIHPDPPRATGMPPMVRFLLRHAAIGFGLAAVFVGALIHFDIGSIGTVLAQSGVQGIATGLLVMMVGLTFSSVQMGYAVMMQSDDSPLDPRGGATERLPATSLQPVPVKATHRR